MKNNDLTVGNIDRVIFSYTLPLLISVFFQQFYTIADSIIAGKFAGEDALAAIGASYPITMIFMAISFGSNIGCSVVLSNLFGKKNFSELKTAASTTLITSFITSVLLSFLGYFGSEWFMHFLNTPSNIFDESIKYFKIYVSGFLFIFIYNISNGVFSAMGDSKSPLVFLIISSLGNVILDLVFVGWFEWGVTGAAWATFLAQGIAGVLAFMFLIQRLYSFKTEKSPLFSFDALKEISFVAIPSILQQSFVSIGNLFIQSLVNGFGSSVVAGYSATVKLNTFSTTIFTTIGTSISNYTGQNLGAKKIERIYKGAVSAEKMMLLIAVPLSVAYFFFSEFFVGLFLNFNASAKSLETGSLYLRIISPFYIIISVKLISDGLLRGFRSMKLFMIATFSDLILRVLLAYILVPYISETGIWISWPIGWVVGTVLSVIFAVYIYRKHKKITKS